MSYDFNSDDIYYFNTHRSKDLVLRLQKRYEGFDDTIVKTLVKQTTGHKIRKLAANTNFGTGHLIYIVDTDGGKFAFRANRFIDDIEHYMKLESKFTELYAKAKIPTNHVIFADTTRSKAPFDYQIMEILPGKDLEDEFTGTKKDYDAISYNLGELAARQYDAPVKGWGRFKNSEELEGSKSSAHQYLMAYVDDDLQQIVEDGLMAQEASDEITKFMHSNKDMLDKLSTSYLVHHDVADHNIRYEGNRVLALFDWENAVAYDPVSEIGSAHTWVCHYPRRKKMSAGFLDTLGYVPEDYEARVSLYFLRTMLWKSAFALRGLRFSERHFDLLRAALNETIPNTVIKMPISKH